MDNNIFSKKPFPLIFSIISCILWGSAFPVLKISYEELSFTGGDVLGRIALGGLRFFLASLLLLLFTAFVAKESLNLKKKDFTRLFILGLVQTGIMYILFYNGVANTTGIKSSIIQGLETFFTIILAHFIYKNDKINGSKAIGIIFGFAGIILTNWSGDFTGGFTLYGEGFLMISSLIGALCAIYVKKISEEISPLLITSYQLLFGSLLMLGLGAPRMVSLVESFTPLAAGLLVYSALLSSVAFALWFTLLKYNKAGEISVYRFIIPVSGAVLSAIFIPSETFTLNIAISVALVALGIGIVNYRK